ncbi:hypothetical protein BMETH_813_0 [methanotrophic bacterial endosymbiont of Bathymodiolus sp.]|nr:hypothetical protein BMETH_813_0 [methanotrophic bacterial endosymbiont of Bathymodiolus sp.]
MGYLRMKKLFVLPVIAFCWSHKVGEWKNDCVLPIKTKTHQRIAQSIFFNSCNHCLSGVECHHRFCYFFDKPMVLFDDVV